MFALPITDGSFGLLPPLLLLSICLFVCLCKQINLCRLKHFGLPGVHSVLSSSLSPSLSLFCAPSASIVMLMTSDELLICCLCPAPELCCLHCTIVPFSVGSSVCFPTPCSATVCVCLQWCSGFCCELRFDWAAERWTLLPSASKATVEHTSNTLLLFFSVCPEKIDGQWSEEKRSQSCLFISVCAGGGGTRQHSCQPH